MKPTFIKLIIFIASFSTAFSIKCFQCNSGDYPQCADLAANDTNSEFYLECKNHNDAEGKPFCRKVVTEVKFAEEIRIHRSCGWIQDKNHFDEDVCIKKDTDFIKKRSCQCFSEGCNSGTRTTTWCFLYLFTIIFLYSLTNNN